MEPSGRAPSLPRGRLHEKQLLASCMKVALLAAKRGGGGVTHPPSIQTKNKKEKGEIRRGEESQNKKRWERRCVEVKRREGQVERERGGVLEFI